MTSSQSDDDGDVTGKKKGRKKKGKKGPRKPRVHGSDSEHSYFSELSEGGTTKRRKRRKRLRDADGKVIGHADDAEDYISTSSDSSGNIQHMCFNRGFMKCIKDALKATHTSQCTHHC